MRKSKESDLGKRECSPLIKCFKYLADLLTEIDSKIHQAWLILEQTKAFKKGLLQKMFV